MHSFKYLKKYQTYIKEQAEAPVDADGNPIMAAPPVDVYSFLFIEEGETGDYKYPDGSSVKSYPTFEISKDDLEQWLSSNVISTDDEQLSPDAIDVRKKNLLDYISGTRSNLSPNDKEMLYKFKNNVLSDIVAKKTIQTDVIFSRGENTPTTDAFNVTFIILPEKKK
jgi:hypothetical protein